MFDVTNLPSTEGKQISRKVCQEEKKKLKSVEKNEIAMITDGINRLRGSFSLQKKNHYQIFLLLYLIIKNFH